MVNKVLNPKLFQYGFFLLLFFCIGKILNAQTPVITSESLKNAFTSFVEDTTVSSPSSPVKVTASSSLESQLLQLLAKPEIISKFRGPQGPQGPKGDAGTNGSSGSSGSSSNSGDFVTWEAMEGQIDKILEGAIENPAEGLSNRLDASITTVNLTVSGNTEISGTLNVSGVISGNINGLLNPGFTTGSVAFQSATGLAQDNANFFWDDTNNRLGLGTITPATTLDINGVTTFRGNILAGTDNTYDIGASGATRPRRLYLGTSLHSPGSLFTNISGQAEGTIDWFGTAPITSTSPNIIAIEDTSTGTRFEAQHIKLLVNPTGAVNSRKAALFVNAETVAGNSNSSSSSIRGIYTQMMHAGSGTVSEMTGIDVLNSTQQGAGNITDQIGGRFISSVGGSGLTVTRSNGVKAQVQFATGAASTISQAVGVQSDIVATGGTIPLAIGFLAQTTGATASTDTIAYYVGSLQGTNQYAFYNSESDAPIYSASSVGIGTTNPGAKLDVAGTLRASNTITSSLQNGATPVLINEHDPTISGTVGTAVGNVGGYKFGQTYQAVRWTNGPGGETDYMDDTWHIGQNIGTLNGGVGRADTSKPNLALSFESKYYQSATFGQEFHLQGVTTDGLTTFRPMSFFIAHDASNIGATFSVDTFTVTDTDGNSLMQVSDANNSVDLAGLKLRFATNNVSAIQQKNSSGVLVDMLYLDGGNVANMSNPLYVVGSRAGASAPVPGSFVVIQPTTANSNDVMLQLAGPSVTGNHSGIVARSSASTLFQQEFNNQGAGDSQVLVAVEGAGDPKLKFDVFGGGRFTLGIDNSDSDKFKISTGAALGSGDVFAIDSSGNVGIGTTTISAKLHSLATTEQLRLGYDASNYSAFTVSSAGNLNITTTGYASIGSGQTDGSTGAKLSVATGIYTPGWVLASSGFRIDGNSSITAGGVAGSMLMNGAAGIQIINGGPYIQYDGTGNGIKIMQSNNSTIGNITATNLFGGQSASSTLTLSGTSNGSPSNAYVILNGSGQGNVGIGTTTPGAPLEISRALGVGDQNVSRFFNSTGNAYVSVGVHSGGDDHARLGFDDVNKYAYLRIGDDNAGRGVNVTYGSTWGVGVGTIAPAANFHILGDSGQTTEGGSPALIIGGAPGGSSVGNRQELNFRSWNGLNGSTAGIGIITTSVTSNELADLYFTTKTGTGDTTATEKMRIMSSGNVGIGVTDPVNKLALPDGQYIGWKTSGSSGGETSGIGSVGGEVVLVGNVGIGTTNPDSALHVKKSEASNVVGTFENTSATNPLGINMYFSGTAPDNNTSYFLYGYDTGATRFIVYSDGDVVNHDNSYGAISDLRLKENIENAPEYLDLLKQVEIKKYSFISDDKNEADQIGVIAQELELILPELVNTGDDGYKSVAYSQFTPLLIKAVQELDSKIEAMTGEGLAGVDSIWDDLVEKLADATNGIVEIIAGTFRATDELCINDTCVNEDELKALLQSANIDDSPSSDNNGNDEEPVVEENPEEETEEPVEEGTPEEEVVPEEETSIEEEPIAEEEPQP